MRFLKTGFIYIMKELLLEKWDEVLAFIRDEFGIKNVSYNAWIRDLKIKDVVDNKVYLYNSDKNMNTSDSASWIQNRYGGFIKGAIAEVTDMEFDVEVVPSGSDLLQSTTFKPKVSNGFNTGITLNSDYTFDNFVVSNTNNTVYAAALRVAEAPGKCYNPLYIYGEPGLGKTHLMNAIAHFIHENSPELKVMYVTCEKFTNELVEALKNGAMAPNDFRDKYRNVDILLIDDIQFIIGKTFTQEEFFHTFNYLYESGKQIVISSDKPAKLMSELDERLRSRFECGLPIDIQVPDFETKMAILRKKLDMKQHEGIMNVSIDDECLAYIANNISTNIRTLEGALTKVLAYANLNHIDIDLTVVEYVLKDMISPNQKKVITPEFIMEVVAEHFDMSVSDIIATKRDKRSVVPRQIAMYLSRRYTEYSSVELENSFKRDHSTILYGINAIESKYSEDAELAAKINTIIKKLNIDK